MKSFLSVVLAACLIVMPVQVQAIQPNDANNHIQYAPVGDKEIDDAIARGIATSEQARNLNNTISEKELAHMLIRTVKYLGKEPDRNITLCADEYGSDEAVNRKTAAVRIGDVIIETMKIKPWWSNNLEGVADKGLDAEYDSYMDRMLSAKDLNSGKRLMEPSEAGGAFHMTDLLTVGEAVRAAYRLSNSYAALGWSDALPILTEVQSRPDRYVSMAEASSGYDTGILTPTALQTIKAMPAVSKEKLPYWTGLVFEDKCVIGEGRRYLNRDTFDYMKENGLNCALINLSFSYLSNPDDLSLVNASELEQLDEVISWAAERGIHVIISCLGIPGYRFEGKVQYMYSTTESVNRTDCPLWSDPKTQKQFEQYWELLAARYAKIDPKLLSFELVWEPSITDNEAYQNILIPVAESVWKHNPDRVIIINDACKNIPEKLMAMGCCVSFHDYLHGFVFSGLREKQDFKYQTDWPLVYMPSILTGETDSKEMTIEHEQAFKAGTLRIKERWGQCSVYADGKLIYQRKSGIPENYEGTWAEMTIPEGTKAITVSTDQGYGFIGLVIKQEGMNDIGLLTTDYYGSRAGEKGAAIVISTEGIASNKEGTTKVDSEYIYNAMFKKFADAADKYGVSLVLSEISISGTGMSEEWSFKYLDMILKVCKEHQIPWLNGCNWDVCYNELVPYGHGTLMMNRALGHNVVYYGNQGFLAYQGLVDFLKRFR